MTSVAVTVDGVIASPDIAATISASVWSAVAEASIPSNLVFSVVVKFFCVNPPSPTEYVVSVSVNVNVLPLLLTAFPLKV